MYVFLNAVSTSITSPIDPPITSATRAFLYLMFCTPTLAKLHNTSAVPIQSIYVHENNKQSYMDLQSKTALQAVSHSILACKLNSSPYFVAQESLAAPDDSHNNSISQPHAPYLVNMLNILLNLYLLAFTWNAAYSIGQTAFLSLCSKIHAGLNVSGLSNLFSVSGAPSSLFLSTVAGKLRKDLGRESVFRSTVHNVIIHTHGPI